jgi:tryptophan synthase alpha chain
LEQAKQAGADGLLIVDLPFELFPVSSLDPILIVTSSTPQERLKEIATKGRGFLYYVCQKGTTGMRHALPSYFSKDIARIKALSTLPVAAGFGISNKENAQKALSCADGFVVGSYLVDAMERKVSPQELTQIAQQIDPRGIL